MNTKKLVFPAMIPLFTIMCVFPNLDTSSFAHTEPAIEDLSGRYVPTAETIELIREEGGYKIHGDISLTLTADRRFVLSNLPDWWHTDSNIPGGGTDSGVGQWSTVEHQERYNVALDFDSREDFSSDPVSSGLSTSIPIVGDAPPYNLWFYIGDPDSSRIMVFERVEEDQN